VLLFQLIVQLRSVVQYCRIHKAIHIRQLEMVKVSYVKQDIFFWISGYFFWKSDFFGNPQNLLKNADHLEISRIGIMARIFLNFFQKNPGQYPKPADSK